MQQDASENKKGERLALYSLRAQMCFWLTIIIAFLSDVLSKRWAIEHIGNPETGFLRTVHIVKGYVCLRTVLNRGAVGGVAAGKTYFLVIVSLLALLFLLWLFVNSKADRRWLHFGLALMVAGAAGNLYDRLFNGGKVVDFIEVNLHFAPFNPWPTFNIADVLLCVGVVILFVSMWSGAKAVQVTEKAQSAVNNNQ